MPDSIQVEGVDDADLELSLSKLAKLPNPRVKDPERFAGSVRELLEIRAQSGWPGEMTDDDVGAFVLVPRPREFRKRLRSVGITDPDATEDPILGKVLLLTRDGSGGEALKMPCAPNDVVDWLVGQGLGDAPLVLGYRATSTMTVRLSGASGERDRKDPIRDTPPQATLTELETALKHFHKTELLTPSSAIKGIWQPSLAAQYVPGPRPEKSIQEGLLIALNHWFRGVVSVTSEERTNVGRIDVRLIITTVEGKSAYWAIVELKLIKSYRHATTKAEANKVSRTANVDAICKGLRQAWAYQINSRVEFGLLEVYDLREDKEDDLFVDEGVEDVIQDLTPCPSYAMRALYGSADDARQAGESGL